MEQYKQDAISILRAVVCGDGTAVPDNANWDKIWKFAQQNHLEAIVFTAAPESQKEKFRNTYLKMVARTVRQEHLLKEIEGVLTERGIHYGLQKGSVLKFDYKDLALRFMSDMDLYIRTEDRTAIRAAMESIGGVFRGSESGDQQFLFEYDLGVAFHGRLLYRYTRHGIEGYPDWGFVDEKSNRLTEEGYALNLIGHAVGDLARSGPGIRYILDLWVYRHRHCPQPDWEAIQERLRKDGIADAAKNLLDLSEYLFGDGAETELMEEMAEYILAGGLYGDTSRGTATEAARSGGRGKAVVRQVFRNRTEFENRYPWLHEHPYLLPLAWGLRLARSMLRNRKKIGSWAASMKNTSREEIERQKKKLTRFGLKLTPKPTV